MYTLRLLTYKSIPTVLYADDNMYMVHIALNEYK